ncbi:MAG: HD domain-containing protein [Bacilli bacterium]|nr:HD domain-containing protein [Bacilli bacterium]
MKLRNKEVEDLLFKSYLEEIMQKKKFLKMNRYIQHGTTTCLLHSIAVAYFSYRLCKFLKIKVHEKELIRGALLHDYFLYDWHARYKPTKDVGLHGIIHPKIALFNARRDFKVNYLEADIIEKHMFPLTFYPPKYRESVVICLVDKFCSIYEVFNKNAYQSITRKVVNEKKERRIISRHANPYV